MSCVNLSSLRPIGFFMSDFVNTHNRHTIHRNYHSLFSVLVSSRPFILLPFSNLPAITERHLCQVVESGWPPSHCTRPKSSTPPANCSIKLGFGCRSLYSRIACEFTRQPVYLLNPCRLIRPVLPTLSAVNSATVFYPMTIYTNGDMHM